MKVCDLRTGLNIFSGGEHLTLIAMVAISLDLLLLSRLLVVPQIDVPLESSVVLFSSLPLPHRGENKSQ